MTSFDLNIVDEKSLVGSQFMARVVTEIQRAAAFEKASRKITHQTKITQQAIADKIGTTRAVVNRQMQGLENLGARRIAEILWALGWEPHFEARKIPAGGNDFIISVDATAGDGVVLKDQATTANSSTDVFVKGR